MTIYKYQQEVIIRDETFTKCFVDTKHSYYINYLTRKVVKFSNKTLKQLKPLKNSFCDLKRAYVENGTSFLCPQLVRLFFSDFNLCPQSIDVNYKELKVKYPHTLLFFEVGQLWLAVKGSAEIIQHSLKTKMKESVFILEKSEQDQVLSNLVRAGQRVAVATQLT